MVRCSISGASVLKFHRSRRRIVAALSSSSSQTNIGITYGIGFFVLLMLVDRKIVDFSAAHAFLSNRVFTKDF